METKQELKKQIFDFWNHESYDFGQNEICDIQGEISTIVNNYLEGFSKKKLQELKKIAKTNPQYKDYWKRFEEENKEEVA